MRYLNKTESSRILTERWQYARAADRGPIRNELLAEQLGFCAYSERFIKKTDAVDIEHFDPRLKPTPQDSYWNWYAVLHWMNQHNARTIERFEPLPRPFDPTIRGRVRYVDGLFFPKDDDDIKVRNLIEFLGWNKQQVVNDRRKHVAKVLDLQRRLKLDSVAEFVEFLYSDPDNLSFATALEAALGCRLLT